MEDGGGMTIDMQNYVHNEKYNWMFHTYTSSKSPPPHLGHKWNFLHNNNNPHKVKLIINSVYIRLNRVMHLNLICNKSFLMAVHYLLPTIYYYRWIQCINHIPSTVYGVYGQQQLGILHGQGRCFSICFSNNNRSSTCRTYFLVVWINWRQVH